jgi:arginine N-succinyltransferase
VLHLVNDFDGASEIAGLFLHPDARTGGMGAMLARSRYLFIAQHRERFGDQVVAELRGWMEGDTSPFWDAVAGPSSAACWRPICSTPCTATSSSPI